VDGAVLIDAGGRIAAVGPDAAVPRPQGTPTDHLPDAVILPGFVNAHTHLELSGLRGQIEDGEFVDWIQHVRRAKEGIGGAEFLAAARSGVRDAWRNGITTVADTGDTGSVAWALAELGGRGVVYQEVFGPDPAQAGDSFAGLRRAVDGLRRDVPASVTIGVSPHAPYTVSAALYRMVAEYARSEQLPLAVHIAESRAEHALVSQGAGPFADLWARRQIPALVVARSPIAYLDRAGLLGPNVLAIHAVQADAEDVALLRARGVAVAACPRSNARHGHGAPPLAAFLDAGIPVGVGTDSVASVADLDLLADARAARELAQLTSEQALRLVTLDAARAIGLAREVGSLETGKWADLCVLRLGAQPRGDIARQILSVAAANVARTYVAGRLVYSS
jgi:5-methylthioadenosine/S-adenosylhomocysteine deaminase